MCTTHAQPLLVVGMPPAVEDGAKPRAAATRINGGRIDRLLAASTYLAVVLICYFVAATFVSPQIIQADREPWMDPETHYYSYETPTRDGGGCMPEQGSNHRV